MIKIQLKGNTSYYGGTFHVFSYILNPKRLPIVRVLTYANRWLAEQGTGLSHTMDQHLHLGQIPASLEAFEWT